MAIDYQALIQQASSESEAITSLQELEAFRVKFLGRKGVVTELLSSISSLPVEERPEAGKKLNAVKLQITVLVQKKQQTLGSAGAPKQTGEDLTLPGVAPVIGRLHPLTQTMNEICRIFVSLGFQVFEGPEIESEYTNFQALNIPLNHPSCDAFDTFYLDEKPQKHEKAGSTKLLLRSHTSPGQIRVMQKCKPPIAAIVPGKVYRPDATDASHSFMFHQVEGFLVDTNVKFSDLKGVLEKFSKEMFGLDTNIRFRPSFFPFTEPSAEVDVSCFMCHQKKLERTCSVCKGTGWIEVLGSGMIHPNVLKAVGYDAKKLTGFAFGMGVERVAMLKYGIHDIRLFFENDIRFLKQF